MGQESSLVAPRFARGCRCFAVLMDGSVAGYGWLSTQPEWVGELQLEIRPRPGEGYIWNCTTVHSHRRRGIFRSLLAGVCAIALGEGLRRLWIGSVAIPAEKAVGPAGFKPALHFSSFRFAGLHVLRMTAAEPAISDDGASVLGARPGWYLRRSRARVH